MSGNDYVVGSGPSRAETLCMELVYDGGKQYVSSADGYAQR
jgi:hypothetical protein